VAIRFISAPLMPVISAGGIRVVLVMSPPFVGGSEHKDTGGEPDVTGRSDILASRV
jgi:hypothetical protein